MATSRPHGGGFLSSDALRDRVYELIDDHVPVGCSGTASFEGGYAGNSNMDLSDVQLSQSDGSFSVSDGKVVVGKAGTYLIEAAYTVESGTGSLKDASVVVSGATYPGYQVGDSWRVSERVNVSSGGTVGFHMRYTASGIAKFVAAFSITKV